ncbi:MAG: AlbA family DNA-binding domain-containing protein, partial [Gammaproteobacteria bacterium]
MIPKPLNEITEADIQEIKANGVLEGKDIEYKRELPGTSDEQKREFLADVSSFANTSGGDIIYGVAENQGVITEIVGLSPRDFDAGILILENLMRDGVAPRMRASLHVVPCAVGKLLIARIDRSWNRPHRVTFRGHDKFYARNAAGKFPLNVDDLRTAFLQSATLSEQIKGFRLDRIIDIANNRGPIDLVKAPTVVLHIIPLEAFSDQTQFDVTVLHTNPTLYWPWRASSVSRRMTFDGILLYEPPGNGSANSYSHFFRNGILEAVNTSLLESREVRRKGCIPRVAFEEQVLQCLPLCFQALEKINVHPPVSVALTLIGIRGLRMAAGQLIFDQGNEIREDTLMLPGTIVESFSAPAAPILK